MGDVIGWCLTVGDPDILGWVTTGSYLAAALLGFRVAIVSRHIEDRSLGRRMVLLWGVVAVLVLALGVNKQLDLQTLLTEVGRAAAKAQGWYGSRRSIQVAFVGAVVLGGTLALTLLVWLTRPASCQAALAIFGVILLLAFVAVRAASMHHVDAVLGLSLGGIEVFRVLELVGAGCVAASAWRETRRIRPAGSSLGRTGGKGRRSGPTD